jgi:hypothetical protein
LLWEVFLRQVSLPLAGLEFEPEPELEPLPGVPELAPEPVLGELEPEPTAGGVEPEPWLGEPEEPEPELEPELEPEPLPDEPEPEVGADAGTEVDVAPLSVVPAPFELVALAVELAAAEVVVVPAAGVLVAAPPPVTVTGEPMGSPVWVGLSPVYAYTGEIRAGVTGATRFAAWPFRGTTGLLPGSAGMVPVVISSTPLVMRQFPPCVKVKKPAVEQQVGSPKAALVHWHLLTTWSRMPFSQPIMKSAWYPYPVGSPIEYTNGWSGFIAWERCASKLAVSRYISMKTRGMVFGKLGSEHVPESGPPEGNATCDLWSAESVFLPSQHEGKLICARMPDGHSPVGSWLNFVVVPLKSRQRKVMACWA